MLFRSGTRRDGCAEGAGKHADSGAVSSVGEHDANSANETRLHVTRKCRLKHLSCISLIISFEQQLFNKVTFAQGLQQV